MLNGHSALFGRFELHSDVSGRSGAGAELEDDEVGSMESWVGRLELLDRLGNVSPNSPVRLAKNGPSESQARRHKG